MKLPRPSRLGQVAPVPLASRPGQVADNSHLQCRRLSEDWKKCQQDQANQQALNPQTKMMVEMALNLSGADTTQQGNNGLFGMANQAIGADQNKIA